jgi:hypothetical protein
MFIRAFCDPVRQKLSRAAFTRAICALGIAVGLAGSVSAAQVEGILMDKASRWKTETRVVPGAQPRLAGGLLQAYVYTKEEALTPEAQKSGYGVITFDSKFLAFDDAGNQKALAALKSTDKTDYLKIEVDGEIEGDKIKVNSLKFAD